MESVRNNVSCYCPQESNVHQSYQASRTQLAAVSSSRSVDMDLVTEEGDRVTLSIDAKSSALYAAHGEAGMDDGALYGQWAEYSQGEFEREVSFSVEGHLNKQERREIRKVIKTINRMMHQFVQGKMNPMMAKAHKLQGLETVDKLEVEMSYERHVLVAQQTQAAISYDQGGEVAPASNATVKAVEAPIKAVEAPIKKAAKAVAQDMAGQVASAQAPMDPLRELVGRLLQAYRDQAEEWSPMGGRIMDHIRDIFESFLEAHNPTSPESESVQALVNEAGQEKSVSVNVAVTEMHLSHISEKFAFQLWT